MPNALFIVLMLVLSAAAQAQPVGSCAPANAYAFLDVGNVRARILNDGGLFYPPRDDTVHTNVYYEAPKGSGVNALFNTSLWVGGMVEGSLRFAGNTYGPYEFWPGPLDDGGAPPADCARYDRLYEIRRDDIDAFNTTGTVSHNLWHWPWHLGAPVLDGDGDPTNYNLDGGDRPALIGHQMLWWVMNDRGNVHTRSGGTPIGMEVHGTAFAYDVAGTFGTTTFHHYRLHYKGEAPLEDAYFGFYVDPDLGYPWDDYLGSDTTLHMGYVYNADNDDQDGYEDRPPAIGYTFLKGAQGAQGQPLGMTTFTCILKSGNATHGEPHNAQEAYHYLQGRWRDGSRIQSDNHPFLTAPRGTPVPSPHCFPGNPPEFWSEENMDGAGTRGSDWDRRFSMSTGPFTMQPGDIQEVIFAIVFAQGEDRLDSVRRLKLDVAHLHTVADQLLAPAVNYGGGYVPPDNGSGLLGFAQNYPNPFTGRTILRYHVPQPMHIRLQVYDALGRRVTTLVDAAQETGPYEVPFDATGLPAGLYLYRLQLDHLSFTRRMLLVR